MPKYALHFGPFFIAMGANASDDSKVDNDVPLTTISPEVSNRAATSNKETGKVGEIQSILKELYILKSKEIYGRYYKGLVESDETKYALDQLEATTKELRKQCDNERKDLEGIHHHSYKTVLQQQGVWEKKKDEAEKWYKESINNFNKSEKELDKCRIQYQNEIRILEILNNKIERKLALSEKANIEFARFPGSDVRKASKLINDIRTEIDNQKPIHLARNKWLNGRTMIIYSQTQIAFGIKKWKNIINSSDETTRYFTGVEARNNLVAACQNIHSCQKYIGKVEFPYADKDSLGKMEKGLNKYFEDVNSDKVAKESQKIFEEVHLEVSDLIFWFQKIIDETIMNDMKNSEDKIAKLEAELEVERNSSGSFNEKEIDVGKKQDWEIEIDNLKSGYLSNIDDLLLMPKPGPNNKSSELATFLKKEDLMNNLQRKLDEYESKKMISEKKMQIDLNKQDIRFEKELRLRKKTKKSYKF
uniref:Secreted protein n=1 Tax=Rhabditophanes sp. KR3021 TaxID=114890 RepID=A0AC35UCJ6_9BILA